MAGPPAAEARVRFGVFDFDRRTLELWKNGRRVRLQRLPARALAHLLDHPGALVTREELHDHLWGDTHLDAEQGLNNAIRQVRAALGDRADAPLYIETLPRAGYRFLAPLEAATLPAPPGEPPHREPVRPRWRAVLLALASGAAAMLALWVFESSRRMTNEKRPASALAWSAYHEGRYFLERGEGADLAASRAAFARAATLAPDYAPALAGLARAEWALAGEDSAARQAALVAAEEALRRAPASAEVHLLRAEIAFYHQWNEELATDHYARALTLDGRAAENHAAHAFFLATRGDRLGALAAAGRALELEPVSAVIAGDVGLVQLLSGEPEEAVRHCSRARELAPEAVAAFDCLLDAYLLLGAPELALSLVRSARPEEPAVTLAHFLDERFSKALDRGSPSPPGWAALAAVRAGHAEEAIRLLGRARELRSPSFLQAAAHPAFDQLRGDARFQALFAGSPVASPR